MKTRRLILLATGVALLLGVLLPATPASATPVFGGWESLGGQLRGAPAVASWGTGRLDVFVRGTDDALWHRSWDGDNWSAWESLGGVLTASPAAVSPQPDRINVVVRGTDNAIWHRGFDGTSWSPWESLGGVGTSAPAIASTSFNRLDMLVKGNDNRMWSRRWTGDRWGDWYQVLTQEFTSGPAATSSTGQVIAAARGTDNATWVFATDSSNMTWLPASSIGGAERDDPAIAWRATNKNVFVRGTDDRLWNWHYNDSGSPSWIPVGGVLTAGPAAVFEGSLNIQVFVRGTDNALWHTTGQDHPSQ